LELTSPDQTVSGKDSSNPLMANNLPKIVSYSTHHVALNEELSSPKANGYWKVEALEQDNVAQALELIQLKQRVKKRMHPNREIIANINADEDVTLKDVAAIEKTAEITKNADVQGRLEVLVRNVDSSTKFYMYLRFLPLMIRAQVGDLSSHTTKCSSPDLTQKQVDDIADEGAAGVDVDVDDVPAAAAEPSIPSPTPTT
nr:hypothetical protein [Tanacetum cinerariifolium]